MPLFPFNPTKKKNIVSTVFFKLRKGGYKDFSMYVNGLSNLNNYVKKSLPSFTIRLFIDKSIYHDKEIMDKINNFEKVEPVLYYCNGFANRNYHIGVFGTLVRFFPMFDFENNDAKTVFIADIDFKKNGNSETIIVKESYEILKKTQNYSNLYLFMNATFPHPLSKGVFFRKGLFIPYSIAPFFQSNKKMPCRILSDFMKKVNSSKYLLSNYMSIKRFSDEKNTRCDENICYGVDEYFLFHDLIDYLIENKLSFGVGYNYQIQYPFYYHIKYLPESEEIKQKLLIMINFINGEDQLTNRSNTLSEKFEKIDNLLYNTKNTNSDEVNKMVIRIYSLYYYLYKANIFDVIPKTFIEIVLSPKNINYRSLNKYIFYNIKMENRIINEVKNTPVVMSIIKNYVIDVNFNI